MDSMSPSIPERRTSSQESRDVFRSFRDSIKNGHCETQELFTARDGNSISQKQCDILVSLLVEELRKETEIDPLTKLFKRNHLEARFNALKKELNYQGNEKRKFPVRAIMAIFLDINDFKHINDTLGHRIGDKTLKAVALRLREATKRIDQIFRAGGDEFIILLPIPDDNDRSLQAIFQRIQRKLNNNLFADDNTKVELAMGYEVLKAGDSRTAEDVLSIADQKMYKNKRMDEKGSDALERVA